MQKVRDTTFDRVLFASLVIPFTINIVKYLLHCACFDTVGWAAGRAYHPACEKNRMLVFGIRMTVF